MKAVSARSDGSRGYGRVAIDDQLDRALKHWQVAPIRAKGGGGYEYIYERFKDLIRKMVLSNPRHRPCAADILDENDQNFVLSLELLYNPELSQETLGSMGID